MTYFDFNSAAEQPSFEPIPKGSNVRVHMTIRPGGFDDASQGWTGGYATRNTSTGSVYLNCEFVVMEGEYARRKMWSLIGLHSPKGPEWAGMGRTFIKAILNSARGIHPADNSPQAQSAQTRRSAGAQRERRLAGRADSPRRGRQCVHSRRSPCQDGCPRVYSGRRCHSGGCACVR